MKRTVTVCVVVSVMGLACGGAWATAIDLNNPSFEIHPNNTGWEIHGYAGIPHAYAYPDAYDGYFIAYGDGSATNPNDNFFRQFLSSPQTYQANTKYTLTFYGFTYIGSGNTELNARVFGQFNWGYAVEAPQGAVTPRTEFSGLANGTDLGPMPGATRLWKKCQVIYDTSIDPTYVGKYITFDIGFVNVPNNERSQIDAVSLDASPVPEPATCGLLALGFGMWLRRRR